MFLSHRVQGVGNLNDNKQIDSSAPQALSESSALSSLDQPPCWITPDSRLQVGLFGDQGEMRGPSKRLLSGETEGHSNKKKPRLDKGVHKSRKNLLENNVKIDWKPIEKSLKAEFPEKHEIITSGLEIIGKFVTEHIFTQENPEDNNSNQNLFSQLIESLKKIGIPLLPENDAELVLWQGDRAKSYFINKYKEDPQTKEITDNNFLLSKLLFGFADIFSSEFDIADETGIKHFFQKYTSEYVAKHSGCKNDGVLSIKVYFSHDHFQEDKVTMGFDRYFSSVEQKTIYEFAEKEGLEVKFNLFIESDPFDACPTWSVESDYKTSVQQLNFFREYKKVKAALKQHHVKSIAQGEWLPDCKMLESFKCQCEKVTVDVGFENKSGLFSRGEDLSKKALKCLHLIAESQICLDAHCVDKKTKLSNGELFDQSKIDSSLRNIEEAYSNLNDSLTQLWELSPVFYGLLMVDLVNRDVFGDVKAAFSHLSPPSKMELIETLLEAFNPSHAFKLYKDIFDEHQILESVVKADGQGKRGSVSDSVINILHGFLPQIATYSTPNERANSPTAYKYIRCEKKDGQIDQIWFKAIGKTQKETPRYLSLDKNKLRYFQGDDESLLTESSGQIKKEELLIFKPGSARGTHLSSSHMAVFQALTIRKTLPYSVFDPLMNLAARAKQKLLEKK